MDPKTKVKNGSIYWRYKSESYALHQIRNKQLIKQVYVRVL